MKPKTHILFFLFLLIIVTVNAQDTDPHSIDASSITGIVASTKYSTLTKINTKQPQQFANSIQKNKPEYFSLRPEIEKAYGYSHAVKIGNDIKISGAVSMDDEGNPTAVGNLEQQMKNCYSDLEKILNHYGCTFEDVVVENVFTTNMPKFLEVAAYRAEIYKNHFPTGSWLGVKELALPEFLIEIEMEVHKAE